MCPAPAFIGRERELGEIRDLLLRRDVRLLTLTGPPGVGKSRLAQEAAARLSGAFPGGQATLNLGALPAAALLPVAIAQAFELPGEGMGDPLARLAEVLAGRGVALLVLDDCEQLEGAAVPLAQALRTAQELTVLATSRSPLGLSLEYEQAVAPLPVPDLSRPLDPVRLTRVPAVELFIARARQVHPHFALTPGNAPAVAELCVQLDGLPLAIELAAARTRVLSVHAMLRDVRPRLELLSRIAADVPARHHTMRGAIGWSYERMAPDEQEVFRALSVFRGPWTADAAAAVTGRSTEEAWRAIEPLVHRSLISPQPGPGDVPAFGMLDVIREFAREQALATGEFARTASRHVEWYLQLAEAAAIELAGPAQARWLERLAWEHANIRAALATAIAVPDPVAAGHLVMRFAAALWRFWNVRGHWQEGLQWCETALASGGAAHPLRGQVLHGAAVLAWRVGDHPRASAYADEAELTCLAAGDRRTAAHAIRTRAVIARDQGEMDQAAALGERSLGLFRELRDPHGTASALRLLGLIDLEQGRFRPELFEESLALSRGLRDERGVAWSTYGRAACALGLGDGAAGALLGEESLRLFREVGDTNGIATALTHLARIARRNRDLPRARALYEESFSLRRLLGDRTQVARLEEEMRGLGEGPAGTTLTARELEVARLVGRGFSNRQIAEALVVSERTAQAHVQHILVKLGVHTRAEIAAWVARLKAAEPPQP